LFWNAGNAPEMAHYAAKFQMPPVSGVRVLHASVTFLRRAPRETPLLEHPRRLDPLLRPPQGAAQAARRTREDRNLGEPGDAVSQRGHPPADGCPRIRTPCRPRRRPRPARPQRPANPRCRTACVRSATTTSPIRIIRSGRRLEAAHAPRLVEHYAANVLGCDDKYASRRASFDRQAVRSLPVRLPHEAQTMDTRKCSYSRHVFLWCSTSSRSIFFANWNVITDGLSLCLYRRRHLIKSFK